MAGCAKAKAVTKESNEKPTVPCWICQSMDYWQTKDGRWLCGECHPRIEELEKKSEDL